MFTHLSTIYPQCMSLVFRQSCTDILGDLSDEDDEEDDDQDNTRFPPLPARKSQDDKDAFAIDATFDLS